mmetsp:Transcript_30236/g.50809  ORF Transcript_30236/g.50809 Transcript_30236/m.50809 type:complete len:313 (-) Transcript_30236:135-1073(-)
MPATQPARDEHVQRLSSWRSKLKANVSCVCSVYSQGVLASFDALGCLEVYVHSRTVRLRTLQCFVLNGLVFLGSILLVELLVIPFARSFLLKPSADSPTLRALSTSVDAFSLALYHFLWLYPIYTISFLLSNIWYRDVATHAYRVRWGDPEPDSTSFKELIRLFVEQAFRLPLVSIFFIQAYALAFIPYAGTCLSCLSFAWLSALFCFEYKWQMQGWDLERRLNYVESNWAFFAGFGTPCTLATYFLPTFVSAGLFALVFPLLIVLAVVSANPQPFPPSCTLPSHLPIFAFAKWASNSIIRWTTGTKKEKRK